MSRGHAVRVRLSTGLLTPALAMAMAAAMPAVALPRSPAQASPPTTTTAAVGAEGRTLSTGQVRLLPGEHPGAADRWYLDTGDGDLTRLKGPIPAKMTPGTTVAVTGRATATTTTVESVQVIAPAPAVVDPTWHDLHIVGIDASGGSDDTGVTAQDVADWVAEIDAYFSRSTRGAVRFRLAEWVPFGSEKASVDGCRFSDVWPAAVAEVGDIPVGDTVIGLSDGSCGGVVGEGWIGNPGAAIYDYHHSDAWAHELGHNLGLGHSGSVDCPGDVISVCADPAAELSFFPYGSDDIMGWATASPADARPSLNPEHLAALDLLPGDEEVTLTDKPADPLTVVLHDVDAASGVRSLRLVKSGTSLRISVRADAGGARVGAFQGFDGDSIRQAPYPLVAGTYGGTMGIPVTVSAVTADTATLVVGDAPEPSPDPSPDPSPSVHPSPDPTPSVDPSPDPPCQTTATLSEDTADGLLDVTASPGLRPRTLLIQRHTDTGWATATTRTGVVRGATNLPRSTGQVRARLVATDVCPVVTSGSLTVAPLRTPTLRVTSDSPGSLGVAITPVQPATRTLITQRRSSGTWTSIRTRSVPAGQGSARISALRGGTYRMILTARGAYPATRSRPVVVPPTIPATMHRPSSTIRLARTYSSLRAWRRDPRNTLPALTDQGRPIRYQASPDTRCRIVAGRSVTRMKGLSKGACTIRATAAATETVRVLAASFRIRIVRR
ncbi:MAG: M66 family metalloprotease [Candidatus Nanopelagicales bacterium]